MTDGFLPPFAQSITENWVALDHFTDRHHAIRRFAEYLSVDPIPETTLFFYGEGGNGKSLLTRLLNDRCARRLPPEKWNEAAAKTGDAFTRYLVQSDPQWAIPSARIDLRYGVETVLELLLSLSHQLAPGGIRFPLFTYACIQYWKATRQLTPDLLKANFPNEELDFAVALADDLTNLVPGATTAVAFFKVVKNRLGPRFDDYAKRRKLGGEVVDTVGRWEAGELYQKLPLIFAEDLNAAMLAADAPKRVVLIIDTYERFWGTPRNVVPSEHPERDAWFRLLLTTLDRNAGIVTVIAGREAPWWDELPRRQRIPVEAISIGEFRDTDARAYLERLPTHDPAVRPRLIELARVGPDRVHPLSLGLAADIAIAGYRKGEDVIANLGDTSEDVDEMIECLLRHLLNYCDDATRYAITALAACRRFTYEIYCRLGEESGFEAKARFAALSHLSFIQPVGGEKDEDSRSYVMHDLLRRLIRVQSPDEVRKAHASMEEYFRAQEGDIAVVEAIFHANQQDWERGLTEWANIFDQAMRFSRYDRCRALLDLLPDLTVRSPWWQGRTLQASAALATMLSSYAKANALYRASINEYDTALRLAPDDPGTHNNKANTLQALGTLLAQLSRTDEARAAYQQSIDSYDTALRFAPDSVSALWGRGITFSRFGKLASSIGTLADGCQYFAAAKKSLDHAMSLAPNNSGIRDWIERTQQLQNEAACE